MIVANPMSPSHANKKGVRYRYYVSQDPLQTMARLAGEPTGEGSDEVTAKAIIAECENDLAAGRASARSRQSLPDAGKQQIDARRLTGLYARVWWTSELAYVRPHATTFPLTVFPSKKFEMKITRYPRLIRYSGRLFGF